MKEFAQTKRTYTSVNYADVVELHIPEVYKEEDRTLSGIRLDPVETLINSHVSIANKISTYLDPSAVAGSETSGLDTVSGISKYFVKQNKLTNISPYLLNKNVLNPLGYKTQDYKSSEDFSNFLKESIIPILMSDADVLEANISTLSAYTESTDASSVHNYLVDTLGWYYLLNTSANGGLSYEPSTIVHDGFVSVYKGNTLETVDGIKGLTEYVWRNQDACSVFVDIPTAYTSGSKVDTSGTQQLEKLKTLIEVAYSPLRINESDFRVQEAFDDFIESAIIGDTFISNGPMRRFSEAYGYYLAESTDEIEGIGLLYDIDKAPEEYLPYLSKLIGWDLLGPKNDRWRHQLREAVSIYKSKGTKGALQKAINAVLSNSDLDLSGSIQEVWESYIPHIIWYALGTESNYFANLKTWTADLALKAGIPNYDYYNLEKNIKIVVDYILLDCYKAYPELFSIGEEIFPVARFYRLDNQGNKTEFFGATYDPNIPEFVFLPEDSQEYDLSRFDAKKNKKYNAWLASKSDGPFGQGVYLVGSEYSPDADYLVHEGDLNFVFNYRGHENFPIPPFEEYKYYDEWRLNKGLLDFIQERLTCFGVGKDFAASAVDYIETATLKADSNLQSFNTMLMLFDSVQVPPNINKVLANTSNYQKNLLDLWCGKSSHIFLNFASDDFDFTSSNLDDSGKFGLFNIARVVRKFTPAHAIPKINLDASTVDSISTSSVMMEYLGFDKDDDTGVYNKQTVLGNGFGSGANSRSLGDGNTLGANGMNAFTRYKYGTRISNVDKIGTNELGQNLISPAPTATRSDFFLDGIGRTARRRRSYRRLLPTEGYYDRTGFNGPVSWDPSALENSTPSSQGELTLGFIPSSQSFVPIPDPVDPPGIWSHCEDLNSDRTFFEVDTSNTFPYRGLSSLGSDYYGLSTPAWYVDRGQTPPIYGIMHKVFTEKAKHNAEEIVDAAGESVWDYQTKYSIGPDAKNVSGFGWVHSPNVSATLNNAVAPDGTLTADLLETTAGDGTYSVYPSIGETYYYSKLVHLFYKNLLAGPTKDDILTFRTYINVGDGSAPLDRPVVFKVTLKQVSYFSFPGSPGPQIDSFEASCNLLTGQVETSIDGDFPFQGEGIQFTKVTDTNWYSFSFQLTGKYSTNSLIIRIKSDNDPADPISQKRNFHIWGTQLWTGDEIKTYTETDSTYVSSDYWKDNITSLTNSAIASGIAVESFEDYENFKFGRGLHKLFSDYATKYGAHSLGPNAMDDTGFNVFAHTYGKGLYNIDFEIDGSGVGDYRASGFETVSAIRPSEIGDSFIASDAGQTVVPLIGTFSAGGDYAAEFRNPYILSGIEFVDTSGSPSSNAFYIYDIEGEAESNAKNQSYLGKPLIKMKSTGGLPRMRFDLSSYGDAANKLIEDHKFRIGFDGLIGDENDPTIGGEVVGVWIHTEPKDGYFWSWAPKDDFQKYIPPAYQGPGDVVPGGAAPDELEPNRNLEGKWTLTKETDLSLSKVVDDLAFKYQFTQKAFTDIVLTKEKSCLGLNDTTTIVGTANDAKVRYFEDEDYDRVVIDFDTRNFTQFNNSEYLDLAVPEEYFSIDDQVHGTDTNYIIEIFFVPNNDSSKFLLIKDLELTDLTNKDRAGIPTGYGVRTSTSPLERVIDEKKYALSKEELREVLKYFSAMAGFGGGMYATANASRVASTTSGVMDTSGGSRLSYRDSPVVDVTTAIIGGTFDLARFLIIEEVDVEN